MTIRLDIERVENRNSGSVPELQKCSGDYPMIDRRQRKMFRGPGKLINMYIMLISVINDFIYLLINLFRIKKALKA